MSALPERIHRIRSFNRFYTQQIGLLRENFLQTRFSLTEARVLYELAQQPRVRHAGLATGLNLDPGYLSRMLRSFEIQGLVRRTISKQDRRAQDISLTAKGRKAFRQLNARSESEIGTMLKKLPESDQETLTNGMGAIRRVLDPQPQCQVVPEPKFTLRTHRPGDIGWLIARHGEIYAAEYNWDETFEGLVARIAGKFLRRHDPARECCWIAHRNDIESERLGCVLLVRQSNTVAKLRLLLVEPSARRMGLGAALVRQCIDFARYAGYKKLTLWTNHPLTSARKIYEAAGFELVEREKHRSFGHDLEGQYWERRLTA